MGPEKYRLSRYAFSHITDNPLNPIENIGESPFFACKFFYLRKDSVRSSPGWHRNALRNNCLEYLQHKDGGSTEIHATLRASFHISHSMMPLIPRHRLVLHAGSGAHSSP